MRGAAFPVAMLQEMRGSVHGIEAGIHEIGMPGKIGIRLKPTAHQAIEQGARVAEASFDCDGVGVRGVRTWSA